MHSGLNEISMDVLPIDEKGTPPESRVKTADAVRNLYSRLYKADEGSAIARTRVQAAKDGQAPFNHAQLVATGQGGNANANFLLLQERVNAANATFIDMVTSVKQLVTISCEYGEPSERHRLNRLLATEVTRTIRRWTSFTPRFQHLVDLFNTHGVGVAYFADAKDFRFKTSGLGEFLIPRDVPATEDAIPYAVARWEPTITELFGYIRDDERARKAGWDPDAVRETISRAVTASSQGNIEMIERLQMEIKNNDLLSGNVYEHVRLLVYWVREFDGKVTFGIVDRENPGGDFLLRDIGRYESPDQAYTLFCYGIGNGTYHSIRGLGHLIFPQVQVHDRVMCKMIDGGLAGMLTWATPESAKALEEATFNTIGPVMMVSPGINLQQRAFPDVSNTGMPILAEMKSMIDSTASKFKAPSQGQVYQNNLNSEQGLAEAAGGSSGGIELFYCSLDRVVREMTRRLLTGPKSDPLVRELHDRLARAGVTPEMIAAIDHASTYAYRAFGAGNPAARTLNLTRLARLLPNLNEIGQKRAIHGIVADIVGPYNADYYAQLPEDPEYSTEMALAELENNDLAKGEKVRVFPAQLHATHAQTHLPRISAMLEAIADGTLDPLENLPVLSAFLDHLGEHGNALVTDPAQQAFAAVVIEAVHNMQQIVGNMERKLRAMEREGGTDEGGQPQQDAAARMDEIKLAMAQYKYDLMQRKGNFELTALQAKAQQQLALNDTKAAMQYERALAFPSVSYQDRRRM